MPKNFLPKKRMVFHSDHTYRWYIYISLLIFISFYLGIGAYPLFDNNEGLYASIGQRMLLDHDFILPYLNCVPYIEKPPLLYWLLAGSFAVFGFKTYAARLVTTTSAALICICLVWFAKKIKHPILGIIAAVIFASSLAISIMARMVYFDMLFALLISCTFWSMFYWYTTYSKFSLRISYACLGLAVLTKGLVALIIVGGSMLAFLIYEKKMRALFWQILDIKGILLFLMITLPWHVAVMIKHPGFFQHYFIQEHFMRFLSKRYPIDYYHGPFYYYLPRMFIYLFPWSFFVPLFFWRPKNVAGNTNTLMRFSWCCFLVPLLFFSFSSAKANYYMLVGVPSLALILGNRIWLLALKNPRLLSLYGSIVLIISGVALGLVGEKYLSLGWLVLATTYAMLAGVTAFLLRKSPRVILVLLAALIVPLIGIMLAYVQEHKNDLSAWEVGQYLALDTKQRPLYIYQDFESMSALAFYMPYCYKIIDSRSSDLYYGNTLPQYQDRFLTAEEFQHYVLPEGAYVIVPFNKLDQFYSKIKPHHSLALPKRFSRAVVVKLKSGI